MGSRQFDMTIFGAGNYPTLLIGISILRQEKATPLFHYISIM